MAGRTVVVLLLAAVPLAACGGESDRAAPPCVVDEEQMASILDTDDVFAAPQQNGTDCIYATKGNPLIRLTVWTRAQFQAERDKFENQGVKLPPLEPVDGFRGQANIDPRYNSLNVPSDGRIVSVEVIGREPSDPAAQLDLEKRIAEAAVDAL
jgi:hypothetical protein